jgi:hypothetical protein
MFFFNNSLGRKHAKTYGSGAFYDLNTSRYQATLPNHLSVG